jgi:hypothetical protein
MSEPNEPQVEQPKPQAAAEPKRQIPRGREFKKKKFGYVTIDADTVFKIKRIDLPTMLLENLMPAPLFGAVEELQNMRLKIGMGDVKSASAGLTKEASASFKELLRRTTVIAVIEPQMTHSRAASLADPDLVWVGGFSDVRGEETFPDQDGDVGFGAMMLVWRAVAGEGGVSWMTDEEARSFRPVPQNDDATNVSDGADVRTKAVVMDRDAGHVRAGEEDREFTHH